MDQLSGSQHQHSLLPGFASAKADFNKSVTPYLYSAKNSSNQEASFQQVLADKRESLKTREQALERNIDSERTESTRSKSVVDEKRPGDETSTIEKESKATDNSESKVSEQKKAASKEAHDKIEKKEKAETKTSEASSLEERELILLEGLLEKIANGEPLTKSEQKSLQEHIDKLFDSASNNSEAQALELKGKSASLIKLEQKLKSALESLQGKDTKNPENTTLSSLLDKLEAKIKLAQKQSVKKEEASLFQHATLTSKEEQHAASSETNVSTLSHSDKQSQSGFSDDSSQDNFHFNKEASALKFGKVQAKGSIHSQTTNPLFKEQLNDLVSRARITVSDGKNGSINLKMYPERLGNVNVQLGLENGTLSGKFLVESKEAKDVLMANLDFLKDQLREQGLDVGSFEVNVRSGEQNFKGLYEREAPELVSFNASKKSEAEIASAEYNNYQSSYYDGNLNLVV